MTPARRVRVFVGEDERYRGRPLFEAIVLEAKERGLGGATVFRGFMGYAPHADIATAGILRLAENLPVVVHIAIRAAFEEAGVRDISVHHGIMGFDRSSGVLSARPLRFHPDLPVVVEAVGSKDEIEAALPRIREVLDRGLITLAEVDLYAPGP